MSRIKLIDFDKLKKDNPTIRKPDLSKIKINDTVKLSNGKESFFVKIQEIKKDYYKGVILNYLLDHNQYNRGTTIVFRAKNIYFISKDPIFTNMIIQD